jgi:hypothetical protein
MAGYPMVAEVRVVWVPRDNCPGAAVLLFHAFPLDAQDVEEPDGDRTG